MKPYASREVRRINRPISTSWRDWPWRAWKDGARQGTTTTDASGSFRFERVPPENYEVQVRQEGFKTETAKVAVGTRSPARLRIVLSIETLNQQITVSGDAAEVSIDSSENRDVAAVDRQALDDLPIFDQDVVATMSRFLDNSALGGRMVLP